MKENNKKLTILVVSLFAVIGVSLAYFVSSMFVGGEGSNIEGNTAIIGGAELKVEGNLEFNDLDILPGHKTISSVKITATGENDLIAYNLIWNGTNTLNTTLNYSVYKSTNNVSITTSCETKKSVLDGAQIIHEECTVNNLLSLGDVLASGEITTSNTTSKVILVEDEFITATSAGEVIYYYVILEYPNLSANQNADIGGSFKGEITVESSDIEADVSILAAYIEQDDGTYKETTDIPTSGYTINSEKSTCSNGAIPNWDTDNNRFYIDNLTKVGTGCYLYFDVILGNTMSEILAGYTQSTRSDFSVIVDTTSTGTVYTAEDDLGTSLYFAGAPTDNWVYFGDFYWRIIRMNGDGSTRLIYAGTIANTTGTDDQLLSTSAFNTNYNDNAYVGYMYGSTGASTYAATHANTNNSTVKETLDTWYGAYLNNKTGVTGHIDGNAGFCSDRQSSNSASGTYGTTYGYGTSEAIYSAYNRLYTNKAPSLKCTNKSADLFTTSGSSQGNGKLTYPVGLITADEVAYAGGVYWTNNTSYYLYTGQNYWALSPYSFRSGYAYVFRVNSSGHLDLDGAYRSATGVRPVINLKSSTKFTGTGTSTDPFIPV